MKITCALLGKCCLSDSNNIRESDFNGKENLIFYYLVYSSKRQFYRYGLTLPFLYLREIPGVTFLTMSGSKSIPMADASQ